MNTEILFEYKKDREKVVKMEEKTNMKKTIIIILIIIMIIIGILFLLNKNNAIASKESKDTKKEELILPSNILNNVNTITSKFDEETNAKGIPIELNDKQNYVIQYNLKKDNKIIENRKLFFEYSDSGKIQSFNITFENSTEDITKMVKLIKEIIHIKGLNIPEDEADQVNDILDNPEMKSTWTETINGRTYSWADMRNSEIDGDIQTFKAIYNY